MYKRKAFGRQGFKQNEKDQTVNNVTGSMRSLWREGLRSGHWETEAIQTPAQVSWESKCSTGCDFIGRGAWILNGHKGEINWKQNEGRAGDRYRETA